MAEIRFEIVKHLGVLSETASGYRKEVNEVRWADNEPKLDIRSWPADHSKPGKGITLTETEERILLRILKARED